MIQFLLDFIFPRLCLGCARNLERNLGARSLGRDNPVEAICETCFRKINFSSGLLCGKCFARIPEGKKICHKDFPYILGAASLYEDEIVRKLIYGLKFQCIKEAGVSLARILLQFARSVPVKWENFIVIPTPLSATRERTRGFNQSEIIGRFFAQQIKIPIYTDVLTRVKHTRPHSEIGDHKKRFENITGCFSVIHQEVIAKKNVVLVDDVSTSGATFTEAARTLKNAGVKNIIALAVARA